jgi:hypothetical protein
MVYFQVHPRNLKNCKGKNVHSSLCLTNYHDVTKLHAMNTYGGVDV